MEDSVDRKLAMQNEVLKWLDELSEKLQKRADSTTADLQELIDQTGVLERDLKTTFNCFRCLSYHQFIVNRIADGEITSRTNENNSVQEGIRAQSYEADILPRYREALSLAISSFKVHLQKTSMGKPTGSVFKIGSTHGRLPHIIGSAEYIHDNTCGLAVVDDFSSDAAPFDFNYVVEPNALFHSSAGESSSRGREKGVSEKDGVEPFVSAALDFKAMLEAALLSPYKFYDEDNPLLPDAVTGFNNSMGSSQEKGHLLPTTLSTDTTSVLQNQTGAVGATASVSNTARNLSFLTDSGIPTHQLSSAILSQSLFDTEEESPHSIQRQSSYIPTSTSEAANYIKISGSTSDVSLQESGKVLSNNENEILEEEEIQEVLTFQESFASDIGSSSSLLCERTDSGEEPSRFNSSICEVSKERVSSGSSLVISHDASCHKSLLDQAVSSSLPLPLKTMFDDFENDDKIHLPEPLYAMGHQLIPKTEVTGITSEASHATSTCRPRFSGVGDIVDSMSESSRSSMISMKSSEMAIEGSFFQREFTQNKTSKSIINEMPRQEELTFSTVVSTSQESSSLFSAAVHHLYDLDTSVNPSKENRSNVTTFDKIVKAVENYDFAESSRKNLQSSAVVGESMPIGDDAVAVDSIQEFSIPAVPVDGVPTLDNDESQRFHFPESEKRKGR